VRGGGEEGASPLSSRWRARPRPKVSAHPVLYAAAAITVVDGYKPENHVLLKALYSNVKWGEVPRCQRETTSHVLGNQKVISRAEVVQHT